MRISQLWNEKPIESHLTLNPIALRQNSRVLAVLSAIGLKCQNMKIVEFDNSLDPAKVAHNKPLHLDQYCLPSISILNMIYHISLVIRVFFPPKTMPKTRSIL